MKYPDTMLGSMLSERWEKENTKADEEIFLDRDPVLFRYILRFYRNPRLVIPHTITKAEMIEEIENFCLPLQKEDIQYDTSSIAGMKDAIIEFENNYVEDLKITAREGAIVACANHLAAMLVDKIRDSPRSESVALNLYNMSAVGFGKTMCPNFLTGTLFTETIQSIVEKAGYTFDEEASNDSCVRLKRFCHQIVR